MSCVVNSWNEWDTLEEIVVGSARGAADLGYEPSLAPYFPPRNPARSRRAGPVYRSVVDDAERQLDHFARLLEGLGVTAGVRGPRTRISSGRGPR